MACLDDVKKIGRGEMVATSEVLTTPGTLTPVSGAQTGLVPTASTNLDVPDGANVALIQVLTKNCRWLDDGTTPTAIAGMQITAGQQFFYTADLAAFKIIQEAVAAEVNVSYYQSN